MNIPDIQKRIASSFGPDSAKANEILSFAISKNEHLNHERIIRSIVYLSQNSLEELTSQINNAIIDPRDVLFAAEYDHSGTEPKRIRDFNLPFED